MPHRSFGAAPVQSLREPISFDFGVYGEQQFTVTPQPSLGDTFDVMDLPEPNPTNIAESARILAKFVSRMLAPEDRPRFAEALYRIPAERADLIVDCAAYIAEQVSGFPTSPRSSSSAGRSKTGSPSKRQSASRRR